MGSPPLGRPLPSGVVAMLLSHVMPTSHRASRSRKVSCTATMSYPRFRVPVTRLQPPELTLQIGARFPGFPYAICGLSVAGKAAGPALIPLAESAACISSVSLKPKAESVRAALATASTCCGGTSSAAK
eukprot:4028831-Amphidinium_carterae.1